MDVWEWQVFQTDPAAHLVNTTAKCLTCVLILWETESSLFLISVAYVRRGDIKAAEDIKLILTSTESSWNKAASSPIIWGPHWNSVCTITTRFYSLFLFPEPHSHSASRVTLTIIHKENKVFQSTNLHDAARCISGSMTSLGGIITAATPDSWTAVLPVPSIGVNSFGPVALGSGRHIQIRPGTDRGQRGSIAGDSRCVGRALGWRDADGRVRKLSRRRIWSVHPCHDPPVLQQSPPLHGGKTAHLLTARRTCWRPERLVLSSGSLRVHHRSARRRVIRPGITSQTLLSTRDLLRLALWRHVLQNTGNTELWRGLAADVSPTLSSVLPFVYRGRRWRLRRAHRFQITSAVAADGRSSSPLKRIRGTNSRLRGRNRNKAHKRRARHRVRVQLNPVSCARNRLILTVSKSLGRNVSHFCAQVYSLIMRHVYIRSHRAQNLNPRSAM